MKKFFWSLSKMLLSIILLLLLVIFTSFGRLYLSLSIHYGVVGSVSFIVFLSCLSILLPFVVPFLCFFRYISTASVLLSQPFIFLSLSLLFPFVCLMLVCIFFSFGFISIFFLNSFSHCINLISDFSDDQWLPGSLDKAYTDSSRQLHQLPFTTNLTQGHPPHRHN